MITVQVVGSKELQRKFSALRLKLRDLGPAWQRIGAKIRRDAIPLTPVRSGQLAATIRNSRARSQTTVRAGNARTVYAGIIHYGGWASGFYGPHYIEGTPFLTTALYRNEDYAVDQVETELDRLINRVGLS